MAGNLTISVPATCTARYLVPTDLTEPQARSLALTAVDAYASGAMRRWIHDVIDTPAVAFAATSGNGWPGSTPRQRELLGRAGQWMSIQVVAPTGIPPGLARQWCAVLTGVAFRFREEFAEAVGAATPATEVLPGKAPAKVRLPAEIKVNADDVGTAYCLPGNRGPRPPGAWRWSPEMSIRLILPRRGDGTLRVHPADGWEGTERDFLESVCDGMIAALTVAEPFVREYQLTGCEALAGSEEGERLEMLEWMDELDRELT